MKFKFYLSFCWMVLLKLSAFSQNVVISEVYGGGGNSGATFKNDFIELYNPTNSVVSLSGFSIQYASATGTAWQVTSLTGSIAAKGYYLIQQAAGTGGTTNLPAPDATGTINMSGTAGKVALVNSTTALVGACPTGSMIIDFVGFGATANCFEGTGATTPPSNTNAIERKANATSTTASMGSAGADEFLGNGYDSNNNTNDFALRTPQPQNSSSLIEPIDLPPSFTSSYPKTTNLTSSGFNVVTSLNESGKTYFVVLVDNAAAPSSTQVKNGQDATGNSLVSNLIGSIDVTTAAADYSSAIAGLTPDTNYDVYVVAEDLINNVQQSPVKVDVKTNVAGDVTPPEFISAYPIVNAILPSGFTVTTNLNEQGKTYFVVLTSGAVAPTSTQVKAGQDAGSAALSPNLIGTINVTTSATEFTSLVTGLTASTTYDVYFVAEDNVPNIQAAPTKVSATTGTLYTENFNDCDGIASFSQFSVNGAQGWGCTDFGRASKGLRMNGFSGTAQLNEDWLISPVVTVNANANLTFYSQFSFAGNSLQLKISSNYTGSGDPSSATWTDLNGNFPTLSVGSTSTALSGWTLSTIDLSAYNGQSVYVAFVYTSTSTSAARWTVDEINFNNATATYMQITPSALQFITGSSVKSYALKGVNLTNNVTVTAPANFEVSKDNVGFSSSLSYTAAEANAQRIIYARFNLATPSAATFSGVIAHESPGVASRNVSVTGTDKSLTLDVVTYNVEFFGTDVKNTGGTEFGPIDDALQISNVTTVMQTIGADIYGLQEVADDNALNTLVTNLPGYDKIVANRWSRSFDAPDPNFPPQKIGFIYNTATVQVINSRVMFSQLYDAIRAGNTSLLPGYPTTGGNTPANFWSSGRLPFMVTFDVTINNVKKRIRVIDIHAKSGSAQADYDRRKYDVKVLHDSLVANYANDNIILVGDYNDDVDVSIGAPTNPESTYKVFVDNTANFNTLTYPLSQTAGISTFPNSSSFLDHIITSNELTNDYVSNSIKVEDPRTYITNYINTTSDHLPVSARFLLTKENQTITFASITDKSLTDVAFSLSASANSGLPITFSTTSTKINLVGTQVTIVSAGRVVINANQLGNTSFNAAPVASRGFCINPAKPSITLSLTTSLTSSGATGNQWFLNDAAISGATNNTYTATIAGNYKVQVKVDDCVSDFSSVMPVVITGDLTFARAGIAAYPNPASESLQLIGLQPEIKDCQVVDILGRSVSMNLDKIAEGHRLEIGNLIAGFYLLRINQGNSFHQLKFIKKN